MIIHAFQVDCTPDVQRGLILAAIAAAAIHILFLAITVPLKKLLHLDVIEQATCIYSNAGVLVAISIPIFTAQLEKSREAVDLANIRAAYAECSTAVLTGETENGVTAVTVTGGNGYQKDVEIVQQKANWTSSNADVEVAGKKVSELTWKPTDSTTKYKVTVTVNNNGDLDVIAKKM